MSGGSTEKMFQQLLNEREANWIIQLHDYDTNGRKKYFLANVSNVHIRKHQDPTLPNVEKEYRKCLYTFDLGVPQSIEFEFDNLIIVIIVW